MMPLDDIRWALHHQRSLIVERFGHHMEAEAIIEVGARVDDALSRLGANPTAKFGVGETAQEGLELELQLDSRLQEIDEVVTQIALLLSEATAVADRINGIESAIHAQLSENASRLRTI